MMGGDPNQLDKTQVQDDVSYIIIPAPRCAFLFLRLDVAGAYDLISVSFKTDIISSMISTKRFSKN
jgi:hypothetical protein